MLLHLLHLHKLLELEQVHGIATWQHASHGTLGGVDRANRKGTLVLHVLADLLGNGTNVFHEFDNLDLEVLEEGAENGVGEDH